MEEVCPECGAVLIKYYPDEEGWGRITYTIEPVLDCPNGC